MRSRAQGAGAASGVQGTQFDLEGFDGGAYRPIVRERCTFGSLQCLECNVGIGPNSMCELRNRLGERGHVFEVPTVVLVEFIENSCCVTYSANGLFVVGGGRQFLVGFGVCELQIPLGCAIAGLPDRFPLSEQIPLWSELMRFGNARLGDRLTSIHVEERGHHRVMGTTSRGVFGVPAAEEAARPSARHKTEWYWSFSVRYRGPQQWA